MRWTPLLAALALAIVACSNPESAPRASPTPSAAPAGTAVATPISSGPLPRPPFAPDGRTTDPRLNAVIERLLHDDARAIEQRTPTLSASEPDQRGRAPTRTISTHDWTTRFAAGSPRSLYAVTPAHPQAAPTHDVDVVMAVGAGDTREAWRFAVAHDDVVDVTILHQLAGAVAGRYEDYLVLPPRADLPQPPPGYAIGAPLPRTGNTEVDYLIDVLGRRDATALTAAARYDNTGAILNEVCTNDPIQPLARRFAEIELADIAHQVAAVRSVITIPPNAQPRADHLIVVSVEAHWYNWIDAALLETDGKIIGFAAPGCVLYPPTRFLVVPRDARPPIDPEPRSGNAVVDAAINAFEARDREAIRATFDLAMLGCVAAPNGIGSPPTCRPGEMPGTPIAVLPTAGCEGGYALADQLDGLLDFLTAPGLEWQLHAVIDRGPFSPDANFGVFLRGNLVAVLSPIHPDQTHGAISLAFSDRGIASVWSGCGPESPARQLARFGQSSAHDYLLAPPPKR